MLILYSVNICYRWRYILSIILNILMDIMVIICINGIIFILSIYICVVISIILIKIIVLIVLVSIMKYSCRFIKYIVILDRFCKCFCFNWWLEFKLIVITIIIVRKSWIISFIVRILGRYFSFFWRILYNLEIPYIYYLCFLFYFDILWFCC
jgi:hypothetical protein